MSRRVICAGLLVSRFLGPSVGSWSTVWWVLVLVRLALLRVVCLVCLLLTLLFIAYRRFIGVLRLQFGFCEPFG